MHYLHPVVPESHSLRCQSPLDLGSRTEPEPDVLVVARGPDGFRHRHPTTALLIVEVGEITLRYDRERKGVLYARAGIPDYWIVNLIDRRVEVYRQPGDTGYAQRTDLVPPATVSPLALPNATLAVAELLA